MNNIVFTTVETANCFKTFRENLLQLVEDLKSVLEENKYLLTIAVSYKVEPFFDVHR